MSERREHRTWCPAYGKNVYLDRPDDNKKDPKIVKGSKRPCQCGADLSERARKLITGEAS